MNNIELTSLEKEVLKWLLAGKDPVLIALETQMKKASKIRREFTGHGFYLYFIFSSTIQAIHKELPVKADFFFGDVEAIIPSLNYGAGFLLWVKNGVVICLEGYTYDETWPKEIKEFTLRYISGFDRDWNKLREQWQQKRE